MKQIFPFLLTLLLTVVGTTLPAQVSNRAVHSYALDAFHLPASLTDAAILDGRLRLASNAMLFVADDNGGLLSSPIIDTDLVAIDMSLEYVVRHPASGTLFYTKRDSKGRSQLFEYYERKPGKMDTRRIKFSGFSYTVEHPVFSPDGHALIFASDCPLGFGARDLWYSEFLDGKWQYPRNMGGLVNSEGDEQLPAMWGDFLVFSSNGRPDTRGGYDLYATRLVALEQTSDTVVMFPIGRSQVQSLQAPFCSADDDLFFVCNAQTQKAWWITRDGQGDERFHASNGFLTSVCLTGVVTDIDGHPVANATVQADQGTLTQTVRTDASGCYTLFLVPSAQASLLIAAPNYFRAQHQIIALRANENDLYAAQRFNITLQSFRLGQPYLYDALYRTSVASELSPAGRTYMDRIAQFLLENPHLTLTISAFYNQSADIPFCMLLNQSRLRTLREYLEGKGVSPSAIRAATTPPQGTEVPDDDVLASPVRQSSLTVAFTFSQD